MTRRLLLGYLALALVVLAGLEVPLGLLNAQRERRDLRANIQRDAAAVGSVSEDALEHDRVNDPRLRAFVTRYADATDGRIAVVDRSGRVIAASGRAAERENEARTGVSVSTGVVSRGRLLGTVRSTYATSALNSHIARYWLALALVAAAVLAAATVAGVLLSRSLVRPLRRVEEAAERIGEGDLAARAPERDGPEEVRHLARTVNETAAKLEALLSSQQAFVANASHQLRSPITALRLRLENLERDVAPEGRESLSSAVAEAEQLTRLVSGLLVLASPQEQAEPAASLDLATVAEARAAAWSALAAEHEVSIEAHGESVFARAGAARVEQVLDNLLANALEVSPRGAVIRVSALLRDEWAELHVVDEGPGLTAEARARAFDRFWRAGPGEGAGLGLAIARRLVAVDEGEIELLPADTGNIDAAVRLRRAGTPAERPRTPSPAATHGGGEGGCGFLRRGLRFRPRAFRRAPRRTRARS